MEKTVIDAGLPLTAGPFNLCVRHGDLVYISGLPPFDADFCKVLRDSRQEGRRPPPMPETPFERQVQIIMDNLKALTEAAGSNMDCLLKVTVWLKDQTTSEQFDRVYKTYFTSQETMPARTRIQAGRTPFDCGLEIDAIGYVPRATPGK